MAVWEVVIDWLIDGTVAQNVLHYQDEDPVSIDWVEFADELRAQMIIDIQDTLVPSITYEGITVRLDEVGSVGSTFTPTLGGLLGTSVNDQYSRVLAMLVRKNADSTVRPNRGRIYVPGVTVEHLDGAGEWDAGSRNAHNDFWANILEITLVEGGDMSMVIKASNPTAPNTVDYNPVSSVGAQRIPATQRRRRIGVGV